MEQTDIVYIEGLRAAAKDFTMVAFYDNLLLKMKLAYELQEAEKMLRDMSPWGYAKMLRSPVHMTYTGIITKGGV